MSRQRLEFGGKRSATPLWLRQRLAFLDAPGGRERRHRFALRAHSRGLQPALECVELAPTLVRRGHCKAASMFQAASTC